MRYFRVGLLFLLFLCALVGLCFEAIALCLGVPQLFLFGRQVVLVERVLRIFSATAIGSLPARRSAAFSSAENSASSACASLRICAASAIALCAPRSSSFRRVTRSRSSERFSLTPGSSSISASSVTAGAAAFVRLSQNPGGLYSFGARTWLCRCRDCSISQTRLRPCSGAKGGARRYCTCVNRTVHYLRGGCNSLRIDRSRAA